MANKIVEVAPNLWHLLGVLLDADPSRRRVAAAEDMDVVEDAEVELEDIATAAFGNDEGSVDEYERLFNTLGHSVLQGL